MEQGDGLLKTHWRVVSRIERFADNAIVCCAFFLSYHFRDLALSFIRGVSEPSIEAIQSLAPLNEYLVVLGFSLPLYNALLSLMGAYRSMRFIGYIKLLQLISACSIIVFLTVGSLLYLFKLDLSRSFVGTFCVVSGIGLLCVRLAVLLALRFFRTRGKNFRNLLIVGTGQQASQLYKEIAKNPVLGIKVIGFVDLGSGLARSGKKEAGSEANAHKVERAISSVYDLGARVVADAESFEVALKKYAVDEVLFTDIIQTFSVVGDLAKIAVEEGVRVTLAADLFSLKIFTSDISYFGKVPLVHYNPSPATENTGALAAKRLIDITVASVALILLFPLLLTVALAIKVDSRGPIFFRQRRVGLNGRSFILLKFRSMILGAEQLLPELKEQNEMTGPVFKMKYDPRVTRVGKLIRRLSIDELPQLINVLRGDMSLVGPRPPLPEEVSLYVRKHRRRLSMRPGLTCIWQVSGRNEIPDFNTWAELDLQYIDTWSLWSDLKLLIRTIPAVLSGSGAR